MNKIRLYILKTSIFLLVIIFFVAPCLMNAQTSNIKKGNSLYRSKKYMEAVSKYERSASARSFFNKGNSMLRLFQPKDAMEQYEKALQTEKNPWYKGLTYHNEGVIFQAQKKYDLAIECYKNALRNNPHDEHSRYNLELCKYLNNKEKQQKNTTNNIDSENNNSDTTPHHSNKSPLRKIKQQATFSNDNAEQMLNVVKQAEQKTQDRVKRNMIKPSPRKLEKNW